MRFVRFESGGARGNDVRQLELCAHDIHRRAPTARRPTRTDRARVNATDADASHRAAARRRTPTTPTPTDGRTTGKIFEFDFIQIIIFHALARAHAHAHETRGEAHFTGCARSRRGEPRGGVTDARCLRTVARRCCSGSAPKRLVETTPMMPRARPRRHRCSRWMI
jgi:hypothetical protein